MADLRHATKVSGTNRYTGWMNIMAVTVSLALSLAAQDSPVRAVSSVDLQRYAGTWHEIARFPNKFQDHCAGGVTATYALRDDGRIDVTNRCRTSGGGMDEAQGIARRVDGSTAKLEVRFAPAWLSFLPMVWGDYWIIGLDPDYRYAVVGDPEREYLWILSRTPSLDPALYSQAVETARANGFDVGKLVKTPQ